MNQLPAMVTSPSPSVLCSVPSWTQFGTKVTPLLAESVWNSHLGECRIAPRACCNCMGGQSNRFFFVFSGFCHFQPSTTAKVTAEATSKSSKLTPAMALLCTHRLRVPSRQCKRSSPGPALNLIFRGCEDSASIWQRRARQSLQRPRAPVCKLRSLPAQSGTNVHSVGIPQAF